MHVVVAGSEINPLIILLHGFPECWRSWKKQILTLSQKGFFVVVPDQRGYNTSSKPANIRDYDIDNLAKDVLGLIKYFKKKTACLIGHDWGGMVSWHIALHYPKYIDKLIIMNAPHPSAMRKYLKRNIRQFFRSWYMLFFQIPLFPEKFLSLGHNAFLMHTLVNSSKPNAFSHYDLNYYRNMWSLSNCLPSMLNWYRASSLHKPKRTASRFIFVPTLLIWGLKDKFLGPELLYSSIHYCKNIKPVILANATHWVQHEEFELINKHILNFIQ